MATIMVVEDEADLNNLVRSHLEADGHTVHQAFDGPTALRTVEACLPHLVILDWMLPGMDGLAVCRQIRHDHLMPIIMLTARNEEIDRVMGLEVGADDYVVKPFSMRELMARVRAILRRVELDTRSLNAIADGDTLPPALGPIVQGSLRINQSERVVTIDGAAIDLTPKEYELLTLLATHIGRAFSRDFLLQHVWGYENESIDRTVDSHITRLRKKLGPLGEKIVTVWGVGYRFIA